MIDQPTEAILQKSFSGQLAFNINEIFFSIQGEGTRAGLPCIFIRLQGCKLRCVWCDTKYALDHRSGGATMTADDIVEKVKSYKCPFVEFTGGEPLEQENVYPLMKYFCDSGYTVALETGGHINIAYIDERVIRILDVKCPDSKMQTLNYVDNLTRLRLHDEVKFVIASEGDYEWAKRVVGEYSLDKRCAAVLFSTSFTDVTPKILAEWILRDNLPVRMQLQMHKFIWDPETRGV